MSLQDFVSYRDRLVSTCSKAIVGKEEEITLVAVCYVCGGHILLEDVPGTGKTMLFRAFSKATGGSFKRIQFTPDVMPSDVTGINFYNMKQGEFEFRPGPVFADMVLADEINRATPRTQSALLEAMAEGQVSVDGVTRTLSPTFMVAATQNPIESYGTFPLPEAQMDRFMIRMKLGYMQRTEEIGVALRRDTTDIIAELTAVVTPEETLALRRELDSIEINEAAMGYIMDIIERTRADRRLNVGASPRGTINLCKAARAHAAFEGRAFVTPDDVKFLAPYVLAHRLHYKTAVGKAESDEIFMEILNEIKVPTEA
ncbi:MAG: MoxR family ATPase [Clostridia bacterium]|jgi:MoxR-like ATPase|nr:MoxR family ATPase [Clostridia bacterium]